MVRTTIKGKKGKPLAASKDARRDVLPRTGMGLGATFVDSASKFLAGYGKILGPALFIVIAGFFIVYFWTSQRSLSEQQAKNKIDQASMKPKLEELRGGMEVVIAEAEGDDALVAYAWYRYAVRAYQLLERPYKMEQLTEVLGVLGKARDTLAEHEQHASWHRHVSGLHARLDADLQFLQNPDNSKLLPWDHHSKADKPEVRLVTGEGDDPQAKNPIIVYVTSVGTLRVILYQDAAPNAVAHIVSLVEEGFYDRSQASALSFSNSFNPTGLFKGATVISAGRLGRPVGVELEKPTTAEEGDDVDTVAVANPYSINYQGDSARPFRMGSFALARDPDEPSRARTEFFIVIEPSPSIGLNFKPLGEVLDGDAGMQVARRLHNADIYYAYVEQKRKDTEYVPTVYYDGWPVPRKKIDKVPDPARFSNLETEVVPADSKLNPLVVFELEDGDIVFELFEDICPNTTANFINLIEERFYNSDCEFYRVEGTGVDVSEIYKGAGARIIQGGYDQSQSREGYDYGIRNEAVDNPIYKAAGLANIRGTVAMARTGQLDSASTEFFINLKDYAQWDSETSPYCVFGEVIHGLELAAKVAKDDVIKSAKVIRKRDHAYVPEVRYKDGGGWVDKKPVTLPEDKPAEETASES